MNENKQSEGTHPEKDLRTRCRDDGHSKGEGEGKAKDGKGSGSRHGNGRGKHGSDVESTKDGTTRSRSLKWQHLCSNAMTPKATTLKSVGRSVQPFQETESEPVVVSASHTPTLAGTRSELTPLSATVGRVRSRVARVEKGVEMRDTLKLAKQRVDVLDSYSTPAMDPAYPPSPALLSLVGQHTPPFALPHRIVSQRHPLLPLDQERIPSPKTAIILGQRWKAKKEFRSATKECEDAGLGPGAKSVDWALKLNSSGMPPPKLGEWNYPEPHGLGRQIGWNLRP